MVMYLILMVKQSQYNFSSTQNIEAITSSTETDARPTGGTLVFDSTGEAQATATMTFSMLVVF